MQVLVSLLFSGLIMLLQSIVGRILAALGMGLVTYTGLQVSLSFFKSTFISSMGSAGPTIAGIFGILKLDVCFSMFVSAALIKFAINGMGGSVTKFKIFGK